jgi:para-aminobenzoate synthetase/4-amino-4-deoxychorismate lyase
MLTEFNGESSIDVDNFNFHEVEQDYPSMNNPIFLSRHDQIIFGDLQRVITTHQISLVDPMLKEIEGLVEQGYFAAGFLSFEAAPAFDPAFKVHPTDAFPLLWFGIYGKMETTEPLEGPTRLNMTKSPWRPLMSHKAYDKAFDVIKSNIEAGETYQVNLTFPLEGTLDGSPQELLNHLFMAQPVDYAAYLDIGDYDIVSLSPELFWKLDGSRIVSKPMKGTRPRSTDTRKDKELAQELQSSPKERAENLMIVDMIRNDLGKMARTGTVRVDEMFELEEYQTVWQMTSTISAEVEVSIPQIMRNLFPPASVTGAPKIKTMELIHTVEPYPRQAYCGTVGWWAPDRQACFNVAIRTLIRTKADNSTRYSVGSGITWDSDGEQEYEECLAKAAVLTS